MLIALRTQEQKILTTCSAQKQEAVLVLTSMATITQEAAMGSHQKLKDTKIMQSICRSSTTILAIRQMLAAHEDRLQSSRGREAFLLA